MNIMPYNHIHQVRMNEKYISNYFSFITYKEVLNMEGNKVQKNTGIQINVDFKEIALNIRRRNYEYIGAGSGRKVFDLGNGYVVKAAKNIRGIAQNQAEYKISLTADDNDLFLKILNVSEGFRLLIMEKAEKVRSISYVWNYFNVKSNKELYKVKELQDISSKYDLVLRDFGSPNNWGRVGDRPVIIDYGFTQQVRKKFYTHRILG